LSDAKNKKNDDGCSSTREKRWPREEEQVALPYSMNESFAVLLPILYICHSERKIHHKKMFLFRNHRCMFGAFVSG
jgi:hypothetical protein